jgi:hypothetical protein
MNHTARHTAKIIRARLFPNLSNAFFSGVSSTSTSARAVEIAPISVWGPIAVTTASADPTDTNVDEKSML